jgi:hypothetical protein
MTLHTTGDIGTARRARPGLVHLRTGGWMSEKHPLLGRGKVFLLDIPFYRTRRAELKSACYPMGAHLTQRAGWNDPFANFNEVEFGSWGCQKGRIVQISSSAVFRTLQIQ